MNAKDRPGTRSQEHEIEIDAPVEAVWRAITEAGEVIRWFAPVAEIDPRPGGTYMISWGEGMDGVSDIVTFEPGKRLRLEHRKMEGSPDMPTGPIAEEWVIETRAGKTVLRLVQSGIPESADWDWFYDGTQRGWTVFLHTLRHYLEHHPGVSRDHIVSWVPLKGTCAESWPTLMGDQGLGMPETEQAGVSYKARTGAGIELAGDVLLADPPYRLLATVEGLNNGLLGATLEQMGPQTFLHLSLSLYGVEKKTVEELEPRWQAWASELFPASGDVAGAWQEMVQGLESAET